jgi:hypothetical protein
MAVLVGVQVFIQTVTAWCSHTQPPVRDRVAPKALRQVLYQCDPKPEALARTIGAIFLIAIPLGKSTDNIYQVIFYSYL